MKVTRDVIYDLLPAYFSGEISQDTRRLVDEFLEQDPEFRQMMERFRAVFREPRPSGAAVPSDAEAFNRAKSWLHKRSELRGYVIGFGLTSLILLFLVAARLTPSTSTGPWLIGLVFAATALIAGVQLYFMKIENPRRR